MQGPGFKTKHQNYNPTTNQIDTKPQNSTSLNGLDPWIIEL